MTHRFPFAFALLLLVAAPSSGRAQPPEDEPTAERPADDDATADEPTDDDAADEPDAETQPPPDGETTTVVVDEREAELRRAQLEMEDEAAEEAAIAPDRGGGGDPGLSHAGQIGVRVGVGLPGVFALRYSNDTSSCRATALADINAGEDIFCTPQLGSGFLDLELSYGLTHELELFGGARLGLAAEQPTEESVLAFGLGLRVYLDPRGPVKLYAAVRAWLDLTQEGEVANDPTFQWRNFDLGVVGDLGLQVDIVRYVGLYAQLGLGLLAARNLSFIAQGSAGAQVRFP